MITFHVEFVVKSWVFKDLALEAWGRGWQWRNMFSPSDGFSHAHTADSGPLLLGPVHSPSEPSKFWPPTKPGCIHLINDLPSLSPTPVSIRSRLIHKTRFSPNASKCTHCPQIPKTARPEHNISKSSPNMFHISFVSCPSLQLTLICTRTQKHLMSSQMEPKHPSCPACSRPSLCQP